VLRATSRSGSTSRRNSVVVALGIALLASAARGDGDWRPLFTDDSVSVSERDAPGRLLPDFRGEVEIAAEPYEVLAVVLDVPAQTEWMWQCRESRVLREESDTVRLVYQVIDAHWPATDRDVVLRSEVSVREPGRRVSVRFTSVESPLAPPVAGLVRMPRLDGEFEIEAVAPARTRVTYAVAADPGGILPAAFVRETVRQSPFDTLVGLRRRVGETRGRYAEIVARWLKRAQ
jgi:hypothetical protein